MAARPAELAGALIHDLFPGLILAIETSCDETSAAVVEGLQVKTNVVSSQAALHQKWGGVVPEAAARAHVEAILPVIEEALAETPKTDLRAIAVTNRPGLVGALSVGVTAAKALSLALDLPLIGIHHLEGHILSPLAASPDLEFPHVCLIVSGGHTELVWVEAPGRYRIIGQTIDDAAGEAFDKASRLLGLGYPGGRAIEDAAVDRVPKYPLPKGLTGDTFDFSFSGFKTAVLRLVEKEGDALDVGAAAASVQETIASVLSERAVLAAREQAARTLTLVGGVAANRRLRELLSRKCEESGIRFLAPPLDMCTDNAAMIGIAASFRLAKGERDTHSLDTLANSPL